VRRARSDVLRGERRQPDRQSGFRFRPVRLQIESFDAVGCSGALLETQATTIQADYFSWLMRLLSNHPLPDMTESVRVSFFIDSGNTSEQVHFDHILFADAVLFRDGFEP
jgi:hypothetical protein